MPKKIFFFLIIFTKKKLAKYSLTLEMRNKYKLHNYFHNGVIVEISRWWMDEAKQTRTHTHSHLMLRYSKYCKYSYICKYHILQIFSVCKLFFVLSHRPFCVLLFESVILMLLLLMLPLSRVPNENRFLTEQVLH